mmetsp:Transcript_50754/g.115282  ORF Transcript_50754/g.115282 Transcript_50754/m.115282 type:complete len:208 (-) Transcript_50754:1458-2081(-)
MAKSRPTSSSSWVIEAAASDWLRASVRAAWRAASAASCSAPPLRSASTPMHGSHTRSLRPEPRRTVSRCPPAGLGLRGALSSKPGGKAEAGTRRDEHEWQSSRAQCRQWCRHRTSLKGSLHSMHRRRRRSGTATGGRSSALSSARIAEGDRRRPNTNTKSSPKSTVSSAKKVEASPPPPPPWLRLLCPRFAGDEADRRRLSRPPLDR